MAGLKVPKEFDSAKPVKYEFPKCKADVISKGVPGIGTVTTCTKRPGVEVLGFDKQSDTDFAVQEMCDECKKRREKKQGRHDDDFKPEDHLVHVRNF